MIAIESIELYRVAMPLIYPWTTGYGSDDVIDTVLVRMRSGDDYGWGETTPLGAPHYSPEYTAGVYAVIRDMLAPAMVGKEFAVVSDLLDALSWVKGNPFAKGGLELAWWDLTARRRSEPLWKTLGGANRTVEVGEGFGVMDDLDMLMQKIDGAIKAGFSRVKLKFCRGWGLEMLSAVRKTFPDTVLHIDCNSAYTLDDLPMFKKVDQFRLAMIEQPLAHDDLIDHARLQEQIATPICLDESVTSPAKARKAMRIGACRWVNIKPGRVGGLSNALEINRICEEAGVPCWVGGMLESGLGAAFCLALGTLANMKYPSDIPTSDRFYKRNLATPDLVLTGPSRMTAPSTPGVGAEPDPERLEAFTVERDVLRR